MKTIFLTMFLITLTFANNNAQGKIDMHGGKEESFSKSSNFSAAIGIVDNYLSADKNKIETEDKKIIKIDEIKIDTIDSTEN
jgi:hypothetical protein